MFWPKLCVLIISPLYLAPAESKYSREGAGYARGLSSTLSSSSAAACSRAFSARANSSSSSRYTASSRSSSLRPSRARTRPTSPCSRSRPSAGCSTARPARASLSSPRCSRSCGSRLWRSSPLRSCCCASTAGGSLGRGVHSSVSSPAHCLSLPSCSRATSRTNHRPPGAYYQISQTNNVRLIWVRCTQGTLLHM